MNGNTQVRGRGRDAPVLTDGHKDQPHRGGRPPAGRVAAKMLGTPSRPRVVTVMLTDGTRLSAVVCDKGGNA